jgi:hypothetical protein
MVNSAVMRCNAEVSADIVTVNEPLRRLAYLRRHASVR